jgi:AbrB family looped-hinge helix DNA binding protein
LAKLDRAELTLTISQDGRILLPLLIRESMGISAGSKILAHLENGTLTLIPLETESETEQKQ